MQIEGTKEAFAALISQRGIYKLLDVDRSTVANWKAYLREGKSISLDKMEEMLIKGRSIVVNEKVWEVNLDRSVSYAMKLKPIIDQIYSSDLGDVIIVDYHAVDGEQAIKTEIIRHAKHIRLQVEEDRDSYPVVKYKFVKNENDPRI